jgi:hypothetical protein
MLLKVFPLYYKFFNSIVDLLNQGTNLLDGGHARIPVNDCLIAAFNNTDSGQPLNDWYLFRSD